ncbi:MAG: hypothetical protein OES38_13965 [Gammaproteobacteria bacterium]|nr:hypothetical protein [Gammaproteobacteria bacterium]
MSEMIRPFKMEIQDVFHFSDNSTVFIGTIEGGGNVITPCSVDVYVGDVLVGTVRLHGERMPGPDVPLGSRVVFTRDEIQVDTESLDKGIVLKCSGTTAV